MRENMSICSWQSRQAEGKRVAERARSVALFSEAVRVGSLYRKRIKGGIEEFIGYFINQYCLLKEGQ